LPIGDRGWCTVTADTPAGQSECGFGSASAACERQISSHYPRGSRVFSGTRDETTTTALCDFERIEGISELFIGTGPVSKRCEFGFFRAGNTCRQVEECTTCGANEAGNPINYISGEKKDVRVDYQSADGRFVIKRHYNSAPFVSSGNNTSMRREFGQNWFLGNFPTLGADITHALGGNFDTIEYRFSYPTGYSTQISGRDGVGRGENAAGRLPSPVKATHPDGSVAAGATGDRRVLITHNNGTEYGFDFPLIRGLSLRGVARKPVTVDFGEGYIHTYAYGGGGELLSITDTYGRQATFEYFITPWKVPNGIGPRGRGLTQLSINGVPTDVIFDGTGRQLGDERQPTRNVLKQITFPDGTYTQYDYDYVSES